MACGWLWSRGDPSAGWELIRALRSGEAKSRRIALGLLSLTKDLALAELPSSKETNKVTEGETGLGDFYEATMTNTPYGLEIIENCNACELRRDHFFCDVPPQILKAFSSASHQSTYPDAALLFIEGQMPRGLFVLCSGRVKLSTTSRDGRVLILKVAEAGEPLGLSAVISGSPYELTAETSGPCHVNFVERGALIDLVRRNGEMGLRSAQALSQEFQSAYRDIHDLVLARSSAGKLARLLLSWTPRDAKDAREIRICSSLTHEEMAQMIGASRETVTRLLSELKKKQFIRLDGSTLVIRNRSALEAMAA